MAFDTGQIPTENQFPCRTSACLFGAPVTPNESLSHLHKRAHKPQQQSSISSLECTTNVLPPQRPSRKASSRERVATVLASEKFPIGLSAPFLGAGNCYAPPPPSPTTPGKQSPLISPLGSGGGGGVTWDQSKDAWNVSRASFWWQTIATL